MDGPPSLSTGAVVDAASSPIIVVGDVDATVDSDFIDVLVLIAQHGR